jgi:hypothetical protein
LLPLLELGLLVWPAPPPVIVTVIVAVGPTAE